MAQIEPNFEGAAVEAIEKSPVRMAWRQDALTLRRYLVNDRKECLYYDSADDVGKSIPYEFHRDHLDWHPVYPKEYPL